MLSESLLNLDLLVFLNNFSKLSQVIKKGEWKWLAARSDAMEAIQSAICGLLYPSPMMKDKVV